MDRYYKSSVKEVGTLYQLQTLINRSNVVTTVSKDYHAVSSFVDTVVDCHVIAAAMTSLQMKDLNDRPAGIRGRIEVMPVEDKARQLKQIARNIVDKYVFRVMTEVLDDIAEQEGPNDPDNPCDGVYNYATGLLKFGLIRRVSMLSTASGDGLRALRHWRFALLAYDQSKKTNYRLEAFILTAAVKCLLPERLGKEITWSRFVNLSGGQGKNLDADYVLELFNKKVKAKLKMLGPNQTPETVMKVARTIMFCDNLAKELGMQLGVPRTNRDHETPIPESDKELMIKELMDKAKVFQFTPARQHQHFNEPRDIFSHVNVAKLHKWLRDKKREYDAHHNGKWAF